MDSIYFIAVDCETAYHEGIDCEICSIGLCIVYGSGITENKYYLVRPENNRISPKCQEIHKISPNMTYNAPSFPEVWKEIGHYFDNNIIVAHNADSAELTYFSKLLHKYNIPIPTFEYICTRKISICTYNIGTLKDICNKLDINIGTHHNASDDARSCAMLLNKTIEQEPYFFIGDYVDEFGGVFNEKYVNKKIRNSEETNNNLKRNNWKPENPEDYIGINIQLEDINPNYNKELYKGKKLCLTGSDFKYGKDLTTKLIKDLGGDVFDKLCKKNNVDILIYSKSAEIKETAKRKNAKKWGIKEISEEAFFESIKLNKIPS